MLSARPAKQRELELQPLSKEWPDLFPVRWWPLPRKKVPAEPQRVPQELRHERKELKLEPSAWPELLAVRWPLEPVRKDLEEPQHKAPP